MFYPNVNEKVRDYTKESFIGYGRCFLVEKKYVKIYKISGMFLMNVKTK